MSIVRARIRRKQMPGDFAGLSRLMPPQAILNDEHLANTVDLIDRLMAVDRLTSEQSHYMETLVQLVAAYEQTHHRIDPKVGDGVDTLAHLLEENDMKAVDLAVTLQPFAMAGLGSEGSFPVER